MHKRPDSKEKAPLLWTDPETGQVFTKPGPGRVPFTPSGAPPNEQSESQLKACSSDLEQLHQQLQKGGIQLGGCQREARGLH